MTITIEMLVILAAYAIAIGVTYGDSRARINMLERDQKETKSQLKDMITKFEEKQERTIERLASIEAILKSTHSSKEEPSA